MRMEWTKGSFQFPNSFLLCNLKVMEQPFWKPCWRKGKKTYQINSSSNKWEVTNLIKLKILFDKIYFKVGFQGVSISNMNDFRMNPGEIVPKKSC